MIDKLIRKALVATVNERKGSEACLQAKGSFAGYEHGNGLEPGSEMFHHGLQGSLARICRSPLQPAGK
jgi:hypothetical protein